MKRCLHCSQTFDSIDWFCPHCGFSPEKKGELPLFSPALAKGSDGFSASSFGPLAALEEGYFWFRARNALILWALTKYGAGISSFMEIGCGTGFVLKGISRRFPRIRIVGSDVYPEGIAFAAGRFEGGEFFQMDACDIPFAKEFDAIGAFDVIEHIDEDKKVLKQIYCALKPSGLLFLTVPQHRWLWSYLDTKACHIRRYSVRELHNKVKLAGFSILFSTSFVTSLLPFMLISRLMKRDNTRGIDPYAEFKLNPVLNKIFEGLLQFEIGLIGMGVSFFIGGSRLVVAVKNG